jgi:hypothetical protein
MSYSPYGFTRERQPNLLVRTPVRDVSVILRNRTRASYTHAGCPSHPSAARFPRTDGSGYGALDYPQWVL